MFGWLLGKFVYYVLMFGWLMLGLVRVVIGKDMCLLFCEEFVELLDIDGLYLGWLLVDVLMWVVEIIML